MGDLAARLSLAQSGATRVIDRLVERGWVAREIPPDNRRTTYAVLTDEGRALVGSVGGEQFWGEWLQLEAALVRRPLPGSD